MSKVQKINYAQKEILGNFMAKHTDFAKSLLPNSSQGSNQLWEQLTLKLNDSGPPTKDAKMWRKVYADQKQNVKRKLSFNKFSKRRTGGGPYEEKVLSQVEEQILAAAGIEVAVEGLKNVKSFGSDLQRNARKDSSPPNYSNENDAHSTSQESPNLFSEDEDIRIKNDISALLAIEDEENIVPTTSKPIPISVPKIRHKERETKTSLLKKKEMLNRLYTLIEIKKKTLEMKEKEHQLNCELKETELQIRRKDLERINLQILKN